ncbi:MAG TPA: hypothetical protein VFF73_09250 [Planctomycetota bacterium]|nr:hypothetical protein [Planctomycetota bacterium]
MALFLSVIAVGCSTPTKDETPKGPIRFAVIAAPELGADDALLLKAVGRVAREPGLEFVLVPGPLLAVDADATSLELLKNALEQIAQPVYVGFSCVSSDTASATKLKREEILLALEKMGPGEEHAVAYHRLPPNTRAVVVNVIGPDGTDSIATPDKGTREVALGASSRDPFLRITVGKSTALARSPASLVVSPLATSNAVVLAAIWPERLEVSVVPLDGAPPRVLEPTH